MSLSNSIHPCPVHQVFVVEHPAKVQNTQKAIGSLGGHSAIEKLAGDPDKGTLGLKLRLKDSYERPKRSVTARTNNLIIRCRPGVHRDTGQKTILSRPVALVKHTIRFREMADFGLSMHSSAFAQRIALPLQTNDARVMANYQPQDDEEPEEHVLIDMPPPAIFSPQDIPIPYGYVQNPTAAKARAAQGDAATAASALPPRQFLFYLTMADEHVPTAPNENVYSNDDVLELKSKLETLFAQCPMWTRRKLANTLGVQRDMPALKFALAHVAYVWRAGPWRDLYCVFGVDPRKDPALRVHQAVYFAQRSKNELPDGVTSNESHVFDGATLYPACRTFALCDITDPILVQLIQNGTLRTDCHPKNGWYRQATLQALRQVMKEKLNKLMQGLVPGNADFRDILLHGDDPDPEEVDTGKTEKAAAEANDADEGDRDDDEALDARMTSQLNQAFGDAHHDEPEFEVDFGSDDSD